LRVGGVVSIMGEVVEIERCALAKLTKSTDLCDQARYKQPLRE
jgi:hypothetical protein